jgi:DNA-binding beta-propeller fold protein YncE
MRHGIAIAGAALAALFAGMAAWQYPTEVRADGRDGASQRPPFVVDADWPKPLPNNWLVGQVAGVAIDRFDHIWIIQRPGSLTEDERGSDPATGLPRRSDCCNRAPSVLVFDRAGNLLRSWGGPADSGFLTTRCTPAIGCEWPGNEHGIFVDHNDFVYIGGNGTTDHQVLKFSMDGTFVLQIGKAGVTGGSNNTNGDPHGRPLLGNPADTEVDPLNNELYIADGYLNKRVLVVDAATGLYKRHWGAYGMNPVNDTDPGPYVAGAPVSRQFRNPVHCVRVAKDGLVYVCDRVNNRYQVFHKNGEFIREAILEPDTLGNGSMWDLDLSVDSGQKHLYNADGENQHVWIFDRATDRVLSFFGQGGRSAGQFHWVHNLAVDSRGNIYTAEVDTGKRAQKFTPSDRERDRDDDSGKATDFLQDLLRKLR